MWVNYYSVGSGSVGLTLGVSEHSEIITFMSEDALDKLIGDLSFEGTKISKLKTTT